MVSFGNIKYGKDENISQICKNKDIKQYTESLSITGSGSVEERFEKLIEYIVLVRHHVGF